LGCEFAEDVTARVQRARALCAFAWEDKRCCGDDEKTEMQIACPSVSSSELDQARETRTSMKPIVHYLRLNAQADWQRHVEEQLGHLQTLTPITAADVVLEHQRENKPGFRVQVRLEVPGPGVHLTASRRTRQAGLLLHGPALHSEGTDSTLEAALHKATQDLERQIQARKLRRLQRGESQLQLSAFSSRWTNVHGSGK
jgi:ribosome-associated translation inhibitor RaiA